jgi:hypothetical protein
MSVNARFQFRRDTAANWTANNPTLFSGEMGLETDTRYFKLGDGATAWINLGYVGVGPTGATGASAGNFGSSTLNFGTGCGGTDTTTVVTGQAGILSTSKIQLWVAGDTTTDHSPDEHLLAGLQAVAQNIVVGTGFTIRATSQFFVTGHFTIRWVWN